ncbi:MAG TPA: pyridoxamine 5'-phosphate oxidase family protein [Actinomycetota bacterium]|nr:pyridoxamine 5'-phosphate oxidase family protein [Actinomycetota bacterium]
MSEVVTEPIHRILEEGEFCHVASLTPKGPHVTPMVFSWALGRVWVTTSRGSVKARAWRRDPLVAGLVRSGDRAAAFTGTVTTYDLLETRTWGRSVAQGPLLALAGFRFTRKNARFFAGYAVDAHHVPLAWTPPGRVFAEIRLERTAILESGRVANVWGVWGDTLEGVGRFRAATAGPSPLAGVPEAIRDGLGELGDGVLALGTGEGPVALPVRWAIAGGGAYAAAPSGTLALAAPSRAPAVALQVDLPSSWRARAMMGAMIRGHGQVGVVDELASGGASATRIARLAGVELSDAALVGIRPATVVWWRGWSSGTVSPT